MVTGKGFGQKDGVQSGIQRVSHRLPKYYLLPALSPSLHSPVEAPAGPLGQVKLTVWYYSEERKLVSIVHSCR